VFVIPAQAGIHGHAAARWCVITGLFASMDPGVRRDDEGVHQSTVIPAQAGIQNL
jgi:hypothetical protein